MKSTAGGWVKQWLGASVFTVSGLALLPLAMAQAQEQHSAQFNFALAAKPLPQALSDFSRVTGISVIYTDEAPYGLNAPAVSGQMSATQALQRLLPFAIGPPHPGHVRPGSPAVPWIGAPNSREAIR